ncbi:hypothetical protein IL306_013698 [Fusarium sp. DS 682]|nr:hypothetical protein IL306_013698 [Fusarium sp. DS 682]
MADKHECSADNNSGGTPHPFASSIIPNNILAHHQRRESGIPGPYLVSLPLESNRFENIRSQLDRIFRRYEYDGGIITIRMPSKIHEDFATEFGLVLQRLIDGILSKMPNAPRITNRGNRPEHEKSHKTRERLPDGQFKDDRAGKPGLVFEVGYSQIRDELEKIAKEYIIGTKGAVTTVVCFDLKYKDGHSLVSVWRAE